MTLSLRRIALFVTACIVLAPAALRADLVSHWTFDGHLEDEGDGGNDGTFFGELDPIFVEDRDGEPESALSFDGIDDYVVVTQNSSLPLYANPEFSIVMWVKGGLQNDKRIWSESSTESNNPLFNLGTQNQGLDGRFDLFVRDAGGVTIANHWYSNAEPFDDTWHHVAWVDDNGSGVLYVDGVRDSASFEYGRPDLLATLDITTIGGILRATECCLFTGVIDDVRIYDHALSGEEVVELFDPDIVCPDAGDTHCGELSYEGPDDDIAGTFEFEVTGAVDDSGDPIVYTFRLDDGAGTVLGLGPGPESQASFQLQPGLWTITVTVDDDPLCFDEADDATCTLELEVNAAAAGLVGHWTMDGTLEDETDNFNDGVPYTGIEPAYVEDINGEDPGAVALNGIDDVIVVQPNAGLPLYNNEAFTVAMWVRGEPQPDFRVWSESSTNSNTPLYNIGTQNNGAGPALDIYIRSDGGGAVVNHRWSTRPVFDGTWHHIAFVDDNGNAVLYVDGVRDETDFSYVRPALTVDTTTIGGIVRANPSHWFLGDIDDVRAYNYALTEEEIIELATPEIECPTEGDTHCDDISVEGPPDEAPGPWTFTANDAIDDSGDPILYTWTATRGDTVLTDGPTSSNSVTFQLGDGTWTVSVTVDDTPFCDDVADDATCSTEVEVFGDPGEALSHWTFDQTLEDELAGNDGAFYLDQLPLFVEGFDGEPDGAIQFDGVDDMVVVQHNEGLPLYSNSAFSITMWVRGFPQSDKRVWSESSDLSNQPLFNIGTHNQGATGQVDIYIRSENGVVVGHRYSDGIAFDGEWHHIAWVDELGQAVLYIDGVRDPVDFSYDKPALDVNITTIGGILRGAECCLFAGDIDDVRAFTYALSAEEVEEIYTGGPVEPSGFVRGDPNSDGNVDLTDGLVILNFLFRGSAAPACMKSADTDDSGQVALTDGIAIFNWLFQPGFPPPAPPSPSTARAYPGSDCAEDPTPDGLDCASAGTVCAG